MKTKAPAAAGAFVFMLRSKGVLEQEAEHIFVRCYNVIPQVVVRVVGVIADLAVGSGFLNVIDDIASVVPFFIRFCLFEIVVVMVGVSDLIRFNHETVKSKHDTPFMIPRNIQADIFDPIFFGETIRVEQVEVGVGLKKCIAGTVYITADFLLGAVFLLAISGLFYALRALLRDGGILFHFLARKVSGCDLPIGIVELKPDCIGIGGRHQHDQ